MTKEKIYTIDGNNSKMSRYQEQIKENMSNKDNIRNICIVSHVDHGKTTLSDHLLQGGGLISRTMAGSARALDYLEEEQQRGITIKTANISFTYKYNNDTYLVNLVDTPGHVDFSGMVSQALRLVDGVIIVVDAVEGIMAQTESVIKQAMIEGLKPILFINKIDRLINELKLGKEEIESRLNTIIQFVNELINQYAYEEWKNKWKVNFTDGTVLIGSALYGWSISKYSSQVPKFEEIIEKHLNDDIDELKRQYPIIAPLMASIIETIPSPIISQGNRIKYITERINDEIFLNIKDCNDNKDITLCIGKLMFEKNRGIIAIARVFSGTIKAGMRILNTRTKKETRIQQVCIYKAQTLLTVEYVNAGNIAVLIGLKEANIGDTLLDEETKNVEIEFKQVSYLQESVISRRIEPLKIADIPKLQELLKIFALIKPNFNFVTDEDTGEIKVHGIGELQLEIIVGEIDKTGIRVEVSDPEVSFAEQIDNVIEIKEKDSLESIEITLVCRPTQSSISSKYIYRDSRNNFLISQLQDNELEQLLVIGFKNSILCGPKSGQSLRNLEVHVKEIIEIIPNSLRYEIIVPALKSIIHKALIQGDVGVYEPIYDIQVTTPVHFLGQVLTVLQKHGCTIEDTKHLVSRTIIIGQISVESSLAIANELRSASEGYAFWQFNLSGYQKVRT